MRKLFPLLLMFVVLSCSNDPIRIAKGVYFWENDTPKLTKSNLAAMDSLHVEKLYIKVFEVDRVDDQNKPIAKSSLQLDAEAVEKRAVVPCVYVLNKVMVQSSKAELDELADNLVFLVSKYVNEKLLPGGKVDCSELQIDCDWSEKSQGNYFYFLRKVKESWKKQVSCTLRLYPYKFNDKMGVPPCDRAMLMCYNLLNPIKNPRKNSILDTEEMSKYLDTKVNYPLPLDVALPVYSWMQCYDRDRFKGVVHGPIEPYSELFVHEEGLWYHSKSDTVLSNVYVRKGDRIKWERVSQEDLSNAVEIIKSANILKTNAVLSYFHLSSEELNFYNYEKLNSYSSRLSD